MTLKFKLYRLKWWLIGKFKINTRFPIHVDIETASRCNLKCIMCPYSQGYDNLGMMSDDMAMEALRQAIKGGISSLKLQFRGEPGLNKRLEEYVRYAVANGVTDVFINTNALAFNERRIKALKDAGLTRVIISADGAKKSTYEAIRVGGDWDTLVKNTNLFLKYGHHVKMQMTYQPSNAHEAPLFKRMWPGADEVVTKPVRQPGRERVVCPQPWRRMIVGWDGMVFGCCNSWHNEFPIGFFPKESLKEIWEGERMRELRDHARHFTGPCKNCDIGETWR